MPIVLTRLLAKSNLAQPDWLLALGLQLFSLPFAVNSALHCCLILACDGSAKAAEDVGFDYAANVLGRLIGNLLSGAFYQVGGITGCLIGSAVMPAGCWGVTSILPSSRSN